MPVSWPQLEFTRPVWLWALLLLPILFVFFSRSLVDLPRRQMIASLIVRCAIATLLVLALAGLNLLDTTDKVFVVFAVDQSLSVDDRGHRAAVDFIHNAARKADADAFAVLPFASRPGRFSREISDSVPDTGEPAGNAVLPNTDDRRPWREGTDLQAAIRIATAGMPPHFVPHIILLSDGNETAGDVLSAAVAGEVRISTVPLPAREDPEIQVSAVNVPAQVAEGEPFNVEVVVDANHDDRAVVEVFSGDYRIAAEEHVISKGENRFRFAQQVKQPTQFSARIRQPRASDNVSAAVVGDFDDTLLDNNLASGLVFTSGKPRVLMIENVPKLAQSLVWAMEEEGISIDVRPPEGMPAALTELQNYEVLILSNVAATDLTAGQMDMIRAYVSELGGGFVMLGGDESFGLGGYYRTVVEDVLPVRCDFKKEQEKPGLGMVLIIDKSGSMGGQKIQLAREAAHGAVDLLSDKDQIGVIAFDGSPYWVSEIRPGSQKGMVLDRIASIEAGGGTTLYPAMEEALQALQSTSAKLKHVIVLTDGYSTPGDFDGITQQMTAARITVSTVGIGDADQDLLERMAQSGNGRYYFSSDPSSIPQIFARETITASKSAIKEEPFLPMMVRATPVLQDINFDEAPFLLGCVVTRPKATSEVILTNESGDPLLAWWRYGLGMSVAFTSDAGSRWAAEWITWPGFNRFWAQVIRHCMRKSDSRGFVFDVARRGSRHKVTIDAVNADGRFLNLAETTLTLINPQLVSESIAIRQSAPGRYEAEVDLPDAGAWHLQVTQKKDGRTIHQQSRGLVVGYSDELRLRSTNDEVLRAIASTTGGTFNPDAADVFDSRKGERAASDIPLWPTLLIVAMVLFVADVALRRLEMAAVFGSESHRSELRS